jgi:hypothetical protein
VSDTPPIFYDVAEVVLITVVFLHNVVLGDAVVRITLG